MAGRRRDTGSFTRAGQKARARRAAGAQRASAKEEVFFCDVITRLCPDLDEREILRFVREDAARRQARVNRLRRMVRDGEYHVHAGFVAAAVLLEDGLAVASH